jgi:serine/threonine-protein kinase
VQDLSNTHLGQYKLIEVIGRGRVSMVYKAYQPSLRRFVAIKVLRNLDLVNAARFEREAQVIAQLHHPNILPIFDYGQQDDLRYFVTQYVEQSVTLGDMLAQGLMEHVAALHMMKHLLAGLAYAHTRGVIHRDIKPSNILFPLPTWPLLADFGIAKLIDDLRQLTPPGQTVGTAAYIAPELAQGLPADARSDLYSVGIVLYEILTGQTPFDAVTPYAVLKMHIYEVPPRPRSLNPALPVEVEALLLRALEKDPAARYQSASDMATDLERIVARLEHERPAGERLHASPSSMRIKEYTTRKLVPDASVAEVHPPCLGAEHPAARHTMPDAAASERSLDAAELSGAASRATLRFSPWFIIAIIIGLLSGMLAAYLLRSRLSEGSLRTEAIMFSATQTFTSIVAREQLMLDLPTMFPAGVPGMLEALPPAASGIPSVLPAESIAPATQPPMVPTGTSTLVQSAVPTLHSPFMPIVSPTLAPSAVTPTPEPPEIPPTEALAPSVVPAPPSGTPSIPAPGP